MTDSRYIGTNTAHVLERLSGSNRALAEAFLRQRRVEGLTQEALYHYALALDKWNTHAQGGSLADASAPEILGFFHELRASGLADQTVYVHSSLIRALLKWILRCKALPQDYDRASYVRPPKKKSEARVLTDAEFHAMLDATGDRVGIYTTYPYVEFEQAMLWTLWDTGFRAQELLSLRIGSVSLDGDGARLDLPPQNRTRFRLKTGPRSIYVVECVPALRAWLGVHPADGDPTAPLFCSSRDRSGMTPIHYNSLHAVVRRASDKAGLNLDRATKTVSPHDFRHTRATRAARAGWVEAKLRAYFGWSPGSNMPSVYVHLAMDDLREQVRRDAGVDDLGYSKAVEQGDKASQLKALLRDFLEEPGPEESKMTRRPADHERR